MESVEDLLDIDNAMRQRTFGKGETLWRKGDASDFVCLIVSGTVALYHVDESGKETFVTNYGPNDLLGEAALYDSQPRLATVKAIEDVVLLITESEDIRRRIDQFDTVSAVITHNLLKKMKTMAVMLDRKMSGLDASSEEVGAGETQTPDSPRKTEYPLQNDHTLQQRTYGAGETLWRKGDASDRVCLITSGTVALHNVDDSGKETFIANCGPDELVGEAALYGSEPRQTNATAVDEVAVLATDGEELRNRIAQFDKVSAVIINSLLGKMKTMADMLNRQTDSEDDTPQEDAQGKNASARPSGAAPDSVGSSSGGSSSGGSSSGGSSSGDAQVEGLAAYGGSFAGQSQAGASRTGPTRRVDWDDRPKRKSGGGMTWGLGLLLILVGGLGVALWGGISPSVNKVSAPLSPPLKITGKTVDIKLTLKIVNKTSVRSMPSEKGQKVGLLEVGDTINVIGKTERNGQWWFRVMRYGGRDGYVSVDAAAQE